MQFKKIILASGSPRRKQLLEWAEIPFDVIIPGVDESYPLGLSPTEVAKHIAANKCEEVKIKLSSQTACGEAYTILAADTIVVLDNAIIGKPSDRKEAIHILSELSGRKHSVITGICISNGEQIILFSDETIVEFHPLTPSQIEYYVDNYKPFDKAGSYAIQEWIGVTGIKSITGDFYNVMGLPVSRIIKELQALG